MVLVCFLLLLCCTTGLLGQVTDVKNETHAATATESLQSYSRTIPGTEVRFDMVAVPGGKFRQGSTSDEAPAAEKPSIEVEVSPFWIGKFEVTWAEYRQFMNLCNVFEQFEERRIRQVTEENKIDAVSAPSKIYDPSFTFQAGEHSQLPAVTMSQFAAKQYTKWLSLLTGEFYRLPTETEWEYACRAGTQTEYSFGDDPEDLEKYAWFEDNADYVTHQVGQKKPNAWGLYDMHGNAAEWTLDQYNEQWYPSLAGKGVLSLEQTLNWPERLFPRVLRGGSMYVAADQCRSAYRHPSDDDELRNYDPNTPKSPWWFASDEAQDVGFRIVRPLKVPPRDEQEHYWEAGLKSILRDVDRRIDKEGRGERGLVDPDLPTAIEVLSN